jgi:hypothetical protein
VHSIEETILRTNAGHEDRRRLRLFQNYPMTLLGLFVLGVFVPELVLLSSSSAAAAVSSSCSSSSAAAAASSSASFLLVLLFLLLLLHSRDSEQQLEGEAIGTVVRPFQRFQIASSDLPSSERSNDPRSCLLAGK